MNEYYTAAEVRKMFNCSRDYVSKLARAKGWRFETYQVNACFTGKRYLAEDVEKELRVHKFYKKTVQ